jgi:hypothetical protein
LTQLLSTAELQVSYLTRKTRIVGHLTSQASIGNEIGETHIRGFILLLGGVVGTDSGDLENFQEFEV